MAEARNILEAVENHVALHGDGACIVDAALDYERISWSQLRNRALCVAYAWRAEGMPRGAIVALDMGNCAAYLYAILAAAYGGYCVAALNARLTDAEKNERLDQIALYEQDSAYRVKMFDEAAVMKAVIAGESAHVDSSQTLADGPMISDSRGFMENPAISDSFQDFAGDCIRRFEETKPAILMFTSGTQGTPKGALLSWANLAGASRASNRALGVTSSSCWQLALPLYHVGGLQMYIRSLLAGSKIVLYPRFDAHAVVKDARVHGATHVSVVDKTLRDMLEEDKSTSVIKGYSCILLGGSAPNETLLREAWSLGVRVVTSYGMTETCSHIAWAAESMHADGMQLLSGYQAKVLDADEGGFGQLAVKGPGVFGGYLNAQASFTDDGYFLTGDRARVEGARLIVEERTSDMFVSGGENIYPEEIRKKLLQIPGITDAFVCGVDDERWGKRPIAYVEMPQAKERDFDEQAALSTIKDALRSSLARMYQPRELMVLAELPRRGIGKVDCAALKKRYSERIAIQKIELWHIALPFTHPIRTAKTRLETRESLIVRITDLAGRTGIGEGVAFSTDWYLPETLPEDKDCIETVLAPLALGQVFDGPEAVSKVFASTPEAMRYPMACAAIETAVWDMYGKAAGKSICEIISGRGAIFDPVSHNELPSGYALGGAVVGMGSISDVVAAVGKAADAGYRRVKLKVAPGHDVRVVRAVQEAYPHLILMLDANQSFTEDDLDILLALDECGIACLEEPLDPSRPPCEGPHDVYDRLERLQARLRCPIALDESWTTAAQLQEILKTHPGLRCVVVKLAKFGGVKPALDFCQLAYERGIEFWLGGMYDTGISKRLHAAFTALPGSVLPGDISDTAAYFKTDICNPSFELKDGLLEVNPSAHPTGLGCDLDEEEVADVTIDYRVFD